MSLINIPASDVLQLVSDLRGEATVNTDASRIRAVSRANQTIAKKRLWKFYRKDLTVTANGTDQDFEIGSATYEMGPGRLSEVYVDGVANTNKYELVDPNEYRSLVSVDSTVKIAYEWYDVANNKWKVRLSQTPDNGTVVYYTFYYLPPAITTTAGVVLAPDIDIPARYALAYILQGEDEDTYQTEIQMAEAMLQKYEQDDDSLPKGQLKTFGVSASIGGYGTY